jgi:hypothetical protein
MVQGREILEKGTLTVCIPSPNREWLLHIRFGGMPFKDLETWFKNEQEEMAAAAERSSLPWGPDQERIEELLISLHRRVLLD